MAFTGSAIESPNATTTMFQAGVRVMVSAACVRVSAQGWSAQGCPRKGVRARRLSLATQSVSQQAL
eukprot:7882624-Alexandrium_andersonii.AAC.1